MKYYSEKLNRLFDSVEALAEEEERVESARAEKEKKLAEHRENRAAAVKKVEEAFKNMTDAQKEYYKVLKEFNEKFGTYHKSISFDDLCEGLWSFGLLI